MRPTIYGRRRTRGSIWKPARRRIRAALNDIARSGNISRLAREAGMSREGLCKALSEDGNPSFAAVMRVARALGMRVRISA